jgi:CelD/BcsL family acetyltransferase involved in cellulose biosynthesis
MELLTGTDEQETAFEIRVARKIGELADIWPRSDSCGTAHCYIFQCADFLEVWCETLGQARRIQSFFVGVFDRTGRPMLLLPLGIERQKGLRVLKFLDGGVCDYNVPIVFEPTRNWGRETLERLWRELIQVLPPFDIAMFDKMPADVGGLPNPLVKLRAIRSEQSGRLINVSGSWEEYIANHLPYRRKSGQQRRKLARVGAVGFTVAVAPEDGQRIVQVMMRQKSRRCVETGQADELELPGYRQYYVAMTEHFTGKAPLLVTALEVDGTMIATSWSLIFNKRFLWMVTTFEGGEWRRFSAGRILLEHLLEWCFSHGMAIFDFGWGDESYKIGYSDQVVALYRLNIPVTLVGKAYQAGRNTKAWALVRPIAKRAFAIARQLIRHVAGF